MTYESKYRHVWLYAKYWYKRNDDIVIDLRKLVSEYAGIKEELVSIDDCFRLLFNALIEATVISTRVGSEQFLLDMIVRLWNPLSVNATKSDNVSEKKLTLLQEMLTSLAMVNVLDNNRTKVIDFGVPDPAVLPVEKS